MSNSPSSQDPEDAFGDFENPVKNVMPERHAIVSDSTCLIGLERIQRLALLPELFDQVHVPPAVAAEFCGVFPWLTVQAPANTAYVAALKLSLDGGEAEANAPGEGTELRGDPGRVGGATSGPQNVRFVGLLRLLLHAKPAGQLPAVRPATESLRAARFFVTDALATKTLRLAGECPMEMR